jgi:hypothetical protein
MKIASFILTMLFVLTLVPVAFAQDPPPPPGWCTGTLEVCGWSPEPTVTYTCEVTLTLTTSNQCLNPDYEYRFKDAKTCKSGKRDKTYTDSGWGNYSYEYYFPYGYDGGTFSGKGEVTCKSCSPGAAFASCDIVYIDINGLAPSVVSGTALVDVVAPMMAASMLVPEIAVADVSANMVPGDDKSECATEDKCAGSTYIVDIPLWSNPEAGKQFQFAAMHVWAKQCSLPAYAYWWVIEIWPAEDDEGEPTLIWDTEEYILGGDSPLIWIPAGTSGKRLKASVDVLCVPTPLLLSSQTRGCGWTDDHEKWWDID